MNANLDKTAIEHGPTLKSKSSQFTNAPGMESPDDKRNPAHYPSLEHWLFANMTLEEAENAREDSCGWTLHVTSEVAVRVFFHFISEVRKIHKQQFNTGAMKKAKSESMEACAQRALDYACGYIVCSCLHDDIADLSEFLSFYEPEATPTQLTTRSPFEKT